MTVSKVSTYDSTNPVDEWLTHRLLRDGLNKLTQLEAIAVIEFGRREKAGVEKTDTGAQHRDIKTFGCEEVNQLSQSDIANLKAVPELVNSDLFASLALVGSLGAGDRLTEAKEWQGEVHEAILVLLNISLSINDLVEFKDDKTSDKCSGRRDGRNDLSGDKLRLVAVCGCNAVVLGTEIACSSDKVDVMVRIVVLLKFYRFKLESR